MINASLRAWLDMKSMIDAGKFERVVKKVMPHVMAAGPQDVADYIDGGEYGWTNAEQAAHDNWLMSSPAEEIADWVIAGLS